MGSLKAFQPAKRLAKKAQRGFRGYPMATVAFYGPDDRRASKVAVGIVLREQEDVAELQRWTSADRDVRHDPASASNGTWTRRGGVGCHMPAPVGTAPVQACADPSIMARSSTR